MGGVEEQQNSVGESNNPAREQYFFLIMLIAQQFYNCWKTLVEMSLAHYYIQYPSLRIMALPEEYPKASSSQATTHLPKCGMNVRLDIILHNILVSYSDTDIGKHCCL